MKNDVDDFSAILVPRLECEIGGRNLFRLFTGYLPQGTRHSLLALSYAVAKSLRVKELDFDEAMHGFEIALLRVDGRGNTLRLKAKEGDGGRNVKDKLPQCPGLDLMLPPLSCACTIPGMKDEKVSVPRFGVILAVLALLPAPWVAAQTAHQHHPPESASAYIKVLEDPERDGWQQPERVISALDLKPGDIVADLGAGSGYFTMRLARTVSPRGKVYAADIDRQLLEYIERRAKEEHLQNVQPILADPHDPKLPPSSVDLIFICDTLHHISDRQTYYSLLARALKPGGRLVNIDFQQHPLPVGPPVEMKISKGAMVEEAQLAGFHLLKEYDFLKYQYFLVFIH